MTKLSLFIYAVDIIEDVNMFFAILGIVSFIVALILAFFIYDAWFHEYDENDKTSLWCRKHTIAIIVTSILAVFGSIGVAIVIPEKQTLYMIAGVETINEFTQTETAQVLSDEMKSVMRDISGIIHSYATEHGAQEAK